MLNKQEFTPAKTIDPGKLDSINLPVRSIHPAWEAALRPSTTGPLVVGVKLPPAATEPETAAGPSAATPTVVPLAVVLPADPISPLGQGPLDSAFEPARQKPASVGNYRA